MTKKIVGIVALMFSCSLLYAQKNYVAAEDVLVPEIDSAYTNFLDQVVITATRTQHTLKDVPVLTKVISKIELNNTGAVTALDALENLVPGLTFNPDDNHGDKIQLQGLDNKYILVLLDGERMVGGRAENVNFARLNVADIQRIEIIDGAASVLYGSSAIGAVINIITKDALKPVDIRIDGRYSNFNSYVANAWLGFKGEKWLSKTFFNTKGTDGYSVAADNEQAAFIVRKVSPSDDYNLSQTVKYSFNNSLNAAFYGSVYLSQLWPYQASFHQRELDYSLGARVNWALAVNNALTFAATTDKYNSYVVTNQANTATLNNNYFIATARATDVWKPNSYLQLVSGYEFNYESSYAPDRFEAGASTHRSYDNNLFMQGEIKLFSDLDCVVGGRLTQHEEFGLHFTPKVSLMYQLKNFRFRAGVSNGFKAPTLKEMYYDFNMGGVSYVKGNPDLNPETSWYESISVEYIAEKFNLSVTGYNNSIKNKISTVEYTNVPGYTESVLVYENISEATIRGVDVAAQAAMGAYFNVLANYAFVDARDEETSLPFVGTSSKHNFTGGILFHYSNLKIGRQLLPLSLNFSGRVASPRLYNSFENTAIVQRESAITSIWRAVYTQNFPAVWKAVEVELQLGIDNLFDQTDPAISINPGRTYFVALKFSF